MNSESTHTDLGQPDMDTTKLRCTAVPIVVRETPVCPTFAIFQIARRQIPVIISSMIPELAAIVQLRFPVRIVDESFWADSGP